MNWYVRVICVVYVSCADGTSVSQLIPERSAPEQLVIHFATEPIDHEQHLLWNRLVDQSVNELNRSLMRDGYITLDDSALYDRLWHLICRWWYGRSVVSNSFQYAHKKNRVFFIRQDKDFGNFTIHIPVGVSQEQCITFLNDWYERQGLPIHIDNDPIVQVAQSSVSSLPNNFQYQGFHPAGLRALKAGTLDTPISQGLKDSAFWHQSFVTVGLRLEKPFYPPTYPFIPHFFSLWQLAPHKGKNIKVAVIDTGAAAFEPADQPAYRKNQDIEIPLCFLNHTLNIVSLNGLDPLEQFVHTLEQYITPNAYTEVELFARAREWIFEFLKNGSTSSLQTFLQENANVGLFDTYGVLTSSGQQALAALSTGENGLKNFTLTNITKPVSQQMITQFLPLARITDQQSTFVAGHGTHTFGLIAAREQNPGSVNLVDDTGVVGIAPNADAFMIKAFADDGTSTKSTLIAGIKKALLLGADLVNLSLKIADNMDVSESSSQLLERMIGMIPYPVCASGNGGTATEAYPARFASVPFDVGAFLFENGHAQITSFSQYEKDIGPKFVAPGYNILSAGLVPSQQIDSMYIFLHGTSMATPIMSGFVALMLGEFKDDFTRQQLLHVCYTSTVKLYATDEWNTKVLLGVLDMRMALFTLHVLKQVMARILVDSIDFDINKKFNNLLAAVQYILYEPVNRFSTQYLQGVEFTSAYMTYIDAANRLQETIDGQRYFVPQPDSLVLDSVEYVANIILNILTQNFNSFTTQTSPSPSTRMVREITNILMQEKLTLFADLPLSVQQRLSAPEKSSGYWKQQAEILRNSLQ